MRLLIEAYNFMAPLMSEVCLFFLACAWLSLLRSVLIKKNNDALIIFVYLNALYIGAQFSLFNSPFDLMAFHWVLFASLLAIKIATHSISDKFNCFFTFLAVSLVIIDQFSILYSWLPHVHLLIVDLIFVAMCLISGYYFHVSHEKKGRNRRGNQATVHFKQSIRVHNR